ncbi:MAG: hypothetical protein JRN58_08670 [Nitrososphaerota archaeon]|nr:hypothetical protein [Nitrososphaerota archaeon]MDG6966446.1 hypothetical protein [Nitrososphaerota archaeon]MDG6979138.1 hypothetical protein [Nitrososphaerota archaeon]
MTTLGKPGERSTTSLDDSQREAVLTYCRIAAVSGALLSVKDLVELLSVDATEEELERSILSDAVLSSKVMVDSGRVLLKRGGSEAVKAATEEAERRTRRAMANAATGRLFARLLSKSAVFMGVAGTTSYLSAAEHDDIDFYCITKTDGMWAFMLRAFILSRIFSLVRRSESPLCFSFVLDERQASEEVSKPQGALYARDTLTAMVISGGSAYHAILESASWMRSYFPAVYARRLREMGGPEHPQPEKRGSRVINLFLFRTLGAYVYLKAWALNRRLTKDGKRDSVFRTTIGPGQLEYASRRYIELGRMYQALEKR